MRTLFPRINSHLCQRAAAHRLLDALRAGQDFDATMVNWALTVTGDMPCQS